ncbi:MAG: hypothetical protein FK731_09930 [Asgard group archaeon]|nr:hypothetical protein [Asgard group archaeon]
MILKEMFLKKTTYILSFLMGAFFAYIGTTVFIPVYLGKAISPNEPVILPPNFTILFTIIELIMCYLGIIIGVIWTQTVQQRRPVMIFGGIAAGLTSLIIHIPELGDYSMLSNLFKILTIFFICICLAAWTFVISEASPEDSGKQIGAILTIAALIGCVVPIIQSILLENGFFKIGWILSSLLLFIMGICGYLSPETGKFQFKINI